MFQWPSSFGCVICVVQFMGEMQGAAETVGQRVIRGQIKRPPTAIRMEPALCNR